MNNADLAQQVAGKVYQSFYEGREDPGHPLEKVWDQFESAQGRILPDSPADVFILQAIAYGIQSALDGKAITPLSAPPLDNKPLAIAWEEFVKATGPVTPGSLSARLFEQAALYGYNKIDQGSKPAPA